MSVTPNADPDIRFLVVRAPASTVESYAYGYTRVIDENPGEGYGPVTIAIVVATFDYGRGVMPTYSATGSRPVCTGPRSAGRGSTRGRSLATWPWAWATSRVRAPV